MTLSQQEYCAIIGDETKEITQDIVWRPDPDHSLAREFRVGVRSAVGRIFIHGRFNPSAEKLSFALVLREVGRIYGLDLGMNHTNPDRVRVGENHKNYWVTGYRDKWAYVPADITEPWHRPVDVWRQFCAEARLTHSGRMYPPVV